MAAPAPDTFLVAGRVWRIDDFRGAFTPDAIKQWNDLVDANAPGLPHWDAGVEEAILRDWMPLFLALGRKRTGNAEITKADDDLTTAVRVAMATKEHGILDTLPSFIPRKISKTRRNDIHDQRKRFFFAIRRYLLEWLHLHASELSGDQMKAIYVYMNSWTEGTGRAREAIHARLEPDHPLTIYDQTNIINAKQKPLPTPAIIPGIVAAIPQPQPAFIPAVLEPPSELNSPPEPPTNNDTRGFDALLYAGNYNRHMDKPAAAAAASSSDTILNSPVYYNSQPMRTSSNDRWMDTDISLSQFDLPNSQQSQNQWVDDYEPSSSYLPPNSQPQEDYDEEEEVMLTSEQFNYTHAMETLHDGAQIVARGAEVLEQFVEAQMQQQQREIVPAVVLSRQHKSVHALVQEIRNAKKKQRNNEGEAITTKAKLNTTDASTTVCARRVCTHRCPSPAIVCHRCLDTVHATYCSQECCEADASDHTALCELERQMAQVRV